MSIVPPFRPCCSTLRMRSRKLDNSGMLAAKFLIALAAVGVIGFASQRGAPALSPRWKRFSWNVASGDWRR